MRELPPLHTAVLFFLVAIKLTLHLVLSPRYGFHSDEMYFIECGRNFAFGYVDHPPIVPWLAGLGVTLFGESPTSIRVFSAVSGTAALALSILLCRQLGGGRWAQALTGLAFLFAPAYLTMHGMLNIPAIEVLIWTTCAHGLVRIAQGGDSRHWLWVGALAGVGLLNKHSMALWGAGVAGGLLFTPMRRELLKPWPWLGGVVAFVVFLPNIIWNITHGWASVEFLSNLSDAVLDRMPRILFALGQILYMHPALFPVWILGLIWLWRAERGRYRLFVWMYGLIFAILFVKHGKPYYLSAIYPVLFAGGAIALEQFFQRAAARRVVTAVIVAAGLFLAPLALPILPLEKLDAYVSAITLGVVPPTDLTGDMHMQHDWPALIDTATTALDSLPENERQRTAFLSGSYGIASALNLLGSERGLPHAYSGQMNHYLWGPPPDSIEIVIAVGLPREVLASAFQVVEEYPTPLTERTKNPILQRPWFVARELRKPWAELWPAFKYYRHGMMPVDASPSRTGILHDLRTAYINDTIDCVVENEKVRCAAENGAPMMDAPL